MLSDEVLSAIEERARRANAVRLSGDYVELGVIASVVREDVPALVAEVRALRSVLRDFAENYDHERDAHRHGHADSTCRTCRSGKAVGVAS